MASVTYAYLYRISKITAGINDYKITNGTDLSASGTVTITETVNDKILQPGADPTKGAEPITLSYSATPNTNAPLTSGAPYYRGTVTINGVAYPVFSSGSGTNNFDYVATSSAQTSGTGIGPIAGAATFPVCLCEGTLIDTPAGSRTIESLVPGDLVSTPSGPQAVKFVSRSTRSLNQLRAFGRMPVRIAAGALGALGPSLDLLISPAHAVLINEHLVEAGALINEGSIAQLDEVEGITLTYYNIELEQHDLITANGLVVESYYANHRAEGSSRDSWDNLAEYLELHGEPTAMQELPHPRVAFARQLPAEVRLLLQLQEAAEPVATPA